MNFFKKSVATLAVAGTLFTAMPAKKAEAGLILLPAGVGIVLVVLGVVYDRLGLFILDGDQAQLTKQVESKLAERYAFIDDQVALNQLAGLIVAKIGEQPVGAEKVEVKLSREEILNVLAPTGLAELEAEKVEAMITELQ